MRGMVQQRLCLACNTPFEVPASSKRKYCSVACHPKQTHSRRARPPVEVECAQCGKDFERKAWVAEQQERLGRAQYCSVECRDVAKRSRKGTERVARVESECPTCGKKVRIAPHEARRGRRFCSKACAAQAPGRGRPGNRATRFTNSNGYVMVYVPIGERPLGQERAPHQPEHRAVMREVLGRWPTSEESVHHVNGDRTDNRPENLQLRSGSHGKGHVLRCRCCGSSDIEYVEL